MEKQVDIDGMNVTLIRKRVRNVNFRVDPKTGRIRVSYPYAMKESDVVNEIVKKRNWIEKALEKHIPVNDGKILLLGKEYDAEYRVTDGKNRIEKEEGRIVFRISSDDEKENARKALYVRTLEEILPELIRECEAKSRLRANGWKIRDMSTRWGSCTPKTKIIRLSLCLAQYDPDCIRSVIYHELAHIVWPDHGKGFYGLLLYLFPDYHECRKRMRSVIKK